MLKGYWNGENTATFVGVLYKVGPADIPTWWQNMCVGLIRQGLLVTYGKSTWLIDNEAGDGYYKLTDGMGSPRCGHKSLSNYTIEREISDDEINKVYNAQKLKEENDAHDSFLQTNCPEEFKRMQALRAGAMKLREKFNL